MTTIYALTEPNNGTIRYIGKSVNPLKRYRNHLVPCYLRVETYKNRWLKSLLKKGKKPGMEILALVDTENANIAEIAYIAACRMMGFDLTNGTDGGDGQSPGYQASVETKRKQSEALKGRPAGNKGFKWASTQLKTLSDAMKIYAARGETHCGAKLTESDVIEIRSLWNTGWQKYEILADYFGVSRRNIWAIIHGQTWKHLL